MNHDAPLLDGVRGKLGIPTEKSVPAPAAAIWYGPFARLSDWWAGGGDARAGNPSVDSHLQGARTDGTPTTATVRARVRWFQERGAREIVEMIRDTAELRRREAELSQQVVDGNRRLAAAERRCASLPEQLTEIELSQRDGGEEHTSENVVNYRRRTKHARLRTATVDAFEQAGEALARAQTELDCVRQAIADRQLQMVAQWARLAAHTGRRIEHYQRRLENVHPDGQLLPELAQSALATALRELVDLVGRYTDLLASTWSAPAVPTQRLARSITA